jgi:branched-chain amino acid aminotransferase
VRPFLTLPMQQKYDPRNRDVLVNINGRLIHRDQAGISPFDSAVQGGDAVWEGLRVYNGRIFRLREHLDRLRDSARALAFSQVPAHEELIAQIAATLKANGMTDGVHIRLTLTRGVKVTSGMDPRLNQSGPTLIVLAEHKLPVYGAMEGSPGIKLITSTIRRFSADTLDPKIHHCNLIQSILAKIQANQAGADDALMLDQRGFVAETNATHVFLVQGAGGGHGWQGEAPRVITPTCAACPEGITRSAVLELCRRHEIPHEARDVSLTEVYRAEEVFCTGTMGELVPVVEVDGRPMSQGQARPMTRRLQALFRELTASEGVPVG